MNISDIQAAVCEEFGIDMGQLLSECRRQSWSRPRHIAMGLTRYLTQKSYQQIAKAFRRKDHSTIIHAVKRLEIMMKQETWEPRIRSVLRRLGI